MYTSSMIIKREISKKLQTLAKQFPVVAVLGPRQSGKTTLVQSVFPTLPYVSLEDLDTRAFASEDPRGFLAQYEGGAILDEVQRVPGLFSYLQGVVDRSKKRGQFILTGSHNYLIQQSLTQTLAGRVAILVLLPLSFSELQTISRKPTSIDEMMFSGFYPRIYDQKIPPSDWYPNYARTYIEKDVRLIKNISDLHVFQKFVKLCAGRVGQILNLTTLGNDCGVSHNTAKSWLSILESSYILFLLPSYHKNFKKRIIKMPKLYFYDIGLACSLLGIESTDQLSTHYARGALFESMIVADLLKYQFNRGLAPSLSYWRDQSGHEIDVILESPRSAKAIEIKSSATIGSDFFRGLYYWQRVSRSDPQNSFLIYAGTTAQKREKASVIPWNATSDIFEKR